MTSKHSKNLNYNSPYELLSMYRRRAGFTQTQLAVLIGLKSYQSISDWESGQSLPRPETLKRLIKHYLLNGVFLKGQEYEEVFDLWTRVKDMFDLTGSIYRLYPPFDQSWFSNLLQLSNRPGNTKPVPIVNTNPLPDLHKGMAEVTISTDKYTRLIGREKDVAALVELIKEKSTRLVTLVGVGGIGKTRLALEVAYYLFPNFRDGVRLVDLSGLKETSQLPFAIAKILGLENSVDKVAKLKGYLTRRELLLVLDNFEQLLDAADLIPELLEAATGLKVMVTSREPLKLYQERIFKVLPLALPDLTGGLEISVVAEYGAVKLFMERAAMVNPAFKLTAENMEVVVRICTRLEGIPLALELIAGHLKYLSPDKLLLLLNNSLLVFNNDLRNVAERHRTMRATIEWSYNQLEAQEQLLFQIAGLFSGGSNLEGLTEVYSSYLAKKHSEIETFEIVRGLVAKSLIWVESAGDGRFNQFESIREYALDRLKESGELDKASAAFIGYYFEFIEKHGSKEALALGTGRKELEREYSNIVAGLEWAIRQGEAQLALRMNIALSPFWEISAYYKEGRYYLEQTLALPGSETISKERGWAIYQLSLLLRRQGDIGKCGQLAQESLEIFQHLENKSGIAKSLESLAIIGYKEGDYETAATYFEESLGLFRDLGDHWSSVKVLINIGNMASARLDFVNSRKYYEEGLLLAQKLGNKPDSIFCLVNLANLCFRQGDYQQAHTYCLESLEIISESGNKDQRAFILNLLAGIEYNNQNYNESIEYLKESHKLYSEMDNKYGISMIYNLLGLIYLSQQNYREARQNLDKALALSYEIGVKQTSAYYLNNLGILALKMEDFTLAVRYQRDSMLIEARLKDLFGIIYNLTGQAAVAIKLFHRQDNTDLKLLERSTIMAGIVTALLKKWDFRLEKPYQEIYEEVLLFLSENLPNDKVKATFANVEVLSLEEIIAFGLT